MKNGCPGAGIGLNPVLVLPKTPVKVHGAEIGLNPVTSEPYPIAPKSAIS